MPEIDGLTVEPEKGDELPVKPVELTEEQKSFIRPDMTDDKWFDYVMKQFTDDELEQGHPKVDGIRRVVEKLLGPIVESSARTIQCPNQENGFCSTVEHKVVIFWKCDESMGFHTRIFTEVSDVTPINTDTEYAIHASATASTKAEGRALRKALKLKNICAAEEISQETPEKSEGKITQNQKNFIRLISKRMNIDEDLYINAGRCKHNSIDDIDYATALEMVKTLSDWQRNPHKIPERLKKKNEV